MGADKTTEGAADTAASDKPKTSKLASLISQAVAEQLAPVRSWQTKVNGELAAVRRRGKSPDDAAPEGEQSPPARKADAAQVAGLTADDLDAAMEIGELRAKLPKELMERASEMLEGKSHQERRDALRLLALAHGGAGETPTKHRDQESAATRTSRGVASPATTHAPRPRSLQEYRQLAKADPKAFERLNADPDFDPSDLPAVAPR